MTSTCETYCPLTSFTVNRLVKGDNMLASKQASKHREIVRAKARLVSFAVGCIPWPMKPAGLFLSLRDNG